MSQTSNKFQQPGLRAIDIALAHVLESHFLHDYEQEYEDLQYLAIVTFKPDIVAESEKIQRQINNYLEVDQAGYNCSHPLENRQRKLSREAYLKRQNYFYFKSIMALCAKHGITVNATFVPVGKEIGY